MNHEMSKREPQRSVRQQIVAARPIAKRKPQLPQEIGMKIYWIKAHAPRRELALIKSPAIDLAASLGERTNLHTQTGANL